MNKFDVYLIIAILIVSSLLIIITRNNKDVDVVNVYYENKIIKKIDLKINDIYTVKGYNGDVVIEVKNKMIRVKKENSPLHICSKQGFTNGSTPIICMPNKIIIKSDIEEYDTVI